MEYKTVVRSSKYASKASERLDEEVNELLLDGWVLLGDVSISISTSSTQYALVQALTKDT